MVTPAERGLESPTVGRACTLVEAERDAAATQVEKSMDEEKSMEGGVYAWMVLCGTVGDMRWRMEGHARRTIRPNSDPNKVSPNSGTDTTTSRKYVQKTHGVFLLA